MALLFHSLRQGRWRRRWPCAGRIRSATIIGAAFILPSFLMVLAIGQAYVSFGGTRIISALFYGIGAAVVAIIARSAIKLIKTSIKKDKLLWAIFLVLGVATAVTEKEIVWLFLAGGLLVMIAKTDFSSHNRRSRIIGNRDPSRPLESLPIVKLVGDNSEPKAQSGSGSISRRLVLGLKISISRRTPCFRL